MAPSTAVVPGDGVPGPDKDETGSCTVVRARRAALLHQSTRCRVTGGSKVQLARPLTDEVRRSITNQTTRLIEKRDEVDRALVAESHRGLQGLTAADWLLRERLLRKTEALARRERRHIRLQNKALKERERLYRQDPSTERAVDLDLIRTLRRKFKRHLGPYLQDRERPARRNKENDGTSSSGSRSRSDSDSDSQDDAGSRGGGRHASRLDGAFDDHARADTKKRKLDDGLGPEKEQRKKTKKGQAGKDGHQAAASTPDGQPGTCIREA